jgi:hypothetical protein
MHAHFHPVTDILNFALRVAFALTLLSLFLAVIHR